MASAGAGRGLRLLLAAGLLGGLAALVALRLAPPAPAPADAPADAFSAGRALERLRAILGTGAPHPVGSGANARVRERILAALRSLGYAPEVQESFACGRYGICARVANVAARLEGRAPGKAVLLAAHYDSVGAGPGAADDGSGVAAVLEIARALRRGPPPARPVVLLLDDGEEGGLIGAEAFLREGGRAREVGAVVNLEARGTGGPSLLFETTGGSAWVAALFARSAARPVATSLFTRVYHLLPNDTDLTVFRALGVPGVNLGFIGDAERYHTFADDLAHLDPGSLQHQGENALGLVRALAGADLDHPPRGDAVFFDLLGLAVISWPEEASVPLAAGALGLALAAAALARRRGRLGWRPLLSSLAAFAAAPLAGALAAAALRLVLARFGALPRPWVAHPAAALAGFWCAGVGAAGAVAIAFRGAGPEALRAGGALGWSLLALAAAAGFPAGGYAVLVPALAAGVAALAAVLSGREGPAWDAASAAVALAAGAVLFPIAILLPDAVGLASAPILGALAALAFSPLGPLAAGLGGRGRRTVVLAPAAACLAAVVAAALVPEASTSRPRQVRIVLHEDAGAGRARWLVLSDGGLPAALRRTAALEPLPDGAFPWMPRPRAFAASVAARGTPGPELRVLGSTETGGRRTVRALLRSPRGASDVMFWIPPGAPIEAVEMDGHSVPETDRRIAPLLGGYRLVRCLTTPPVGVEVRVVIAGTAQIEVEVVDQTAGLPIDGGKLEASRPDDAVTFQDGDTTILTRRVGL